MGELVHEERKNWNVTMTNSCAPKGKARDWSRGLLCGQINLRLAASLTECLADIRMMGVGGEVVKLSAQARALRRMPHRERKP
jgi:hypothetical protein